MFCVTDLMFSREELIELLEASGFSYQVDQENPCVMFSDGSHHSYDELPLPSDYLKTCSFTI